MAYVRLNLLLMGKTGHGKSMTGNSILGSRKFTVSSNVQSQTKEMEDGYVTFGNYNVKVIDGPGLKDTTKDAAEDQETAAATMLQAMAMCDGGVDAFLFVYKYGSRFTEEERKALEGLKYIFGEKYFQNLIVVVTMGDLFRDDMEDQGIGEITFRDWCRQQTGPFRQLFDDCRDRFILFNNREKNENAMNKQRQEIIELAHQLHEFNGRYTSEAFEQAKDLREGYIIQNKVPILGDEIQKICACLSADLQTYIEKPTESVKVKIQEMIAHTKKEIKDKDKGTNLLHHLLVSVERIEENLNNIDELGKLKQELEKTRKARIEWTAFGSFCASMSGAYTALASVSLWKKLLAFTGAGSAAATTGAVGAGSPTAAAGAVALGVSLVSGSIVATIFKYLRLSEKEDDTKMKQDQINSRLEKAGFQFNKK